MKNWYAAHIIMFIEFKNDIQCYFPIWENVVLVEAESEAVAFEKADRCGLQGEGDDGGSFSWDDRPARWVFAGVRKLTECAVLAGSPGDGTEITYSELVVDSKAAIDRLVAGDPVEVRYNDRFRPVPARPDEEPRRHQRKQA